MKKLFIVSDVHSFYDEMIKALNDKGFDLNNSNHIFVSLGDLTDRGNLALECLQFVNSLPDDRKILIRGNHEDLIMSIVKYQHFLMYDYHNGSVGTIYQIILKKEGSITDREAIECFSNNLDWSQYINSCVNYWEDNNNVFVHGWIPVEFKLTSPWHDEDIAIYKENWRDGSWAEAAWLNGMHAWHQGVRIPGKTIWCGHWHSSWGHANLHHDGRELLGRIETYHINPETGRLEPYVRHDPFKDEGIVCMDACTVISGIVNCEILEIDN